MEFRNQLLASQEALCSMRLDIVCAYTQETSLAAYLKYLPSVVFKKAKILVNPSFMRPTNVVRNTEFRTYVTINIYGELLSRTAVVTGY
jgi:hypothetical protein